MPKIALVYDRVNKFGGAERVLQCLHELYPDAPLYTSVYDPTGAPWAAGWDIRPSFLQSVPLASKHHEWFVNWMPAAFESFDFRGFDVVLSVTSAEAKGILVSPPTKHICYLLTPTRYLWSHTHDYAGSGFLGGLRRLFLSGLRQWDFVSAQRPDVLAAISTTVAERATKYYRRTPQQVLYPPVEVNRFRDHPAVCITPKRNYYLVVSRLVPYKQVATAVKAFKDLPQEHVLVVGSGSEASALHHLAGSNVSFIPAIDDAGLACLYHHARALIFPQEEDFGLVAVEAQAAGIPVVALKAGGATETVIHGCTGILYDKNDVTSLIEAIHQSQLITWSPELIKRQAEKFAKLTFMSAIDQLVKESL